MYISMYEAACSLSTLDYMFATVGIITIGVMCILAIAFVFSELSIFIDWLKDVNEMVQIRRETIRKVGKR